jgi:ketosteroid isomerase-like protein
MCEPTPAALARSYYETIDTDRYEALANRLDPAFVHVRPDQTLRGRDRFVTFMCEERPMTDTEHVVDAVYATDPGVDTSNGDSGSEKTGIAVRGRLLEATGDELFTFLDVFTVADGRLTRLETYVPVE